MQDVQDFYGLEADTIKNQVLAMDAAADTGSFLI